MKSVRGARQLTLAVAVLTLGTVASAIAVEPPPSRKMSRQIEVMEKILDQVLLDSPNFLIRSTPVARGSYLPGFGVLFTFDASLIEHGWKGFDVDKWKKGFRIEEHNGQRVIILGDDWDEDEDDEEEIDLEDDDIRTWPERRRARSARVYARGKTEMVDVLLDYGDTMTSLDGDQWVAIQAFFTDEDFIDREDVSRLILKAKVGDLRAYAAGDLSEEQAVKRIVEQVY